MFFKPFSMKGFLFVLLLSISSLFYGQCSPDTIYADSAWGIWPSPIENFPPGEIDEEYFEIINFKIPEDASLIDSVVGEGLVIQSIMLDSVSNIPPGLSFSCDNSSCTWLANGAGCAEITGVPTTNGSYQISLDVIANVEIEIFGNITTIPYPYSFDGYIINIGPVGIENYRLFNNTLKLESAIPNPCNQYTTVQFVSGQQKNIEFKLTNLLGEVIYNYSISSGKGVNNIPLNTTLYKNGIYIYSISDGISFQSKRLIINH